MAMQVSKGTMPQEGNPRGEAVDAEELQQFILDLAGWLDKSAKPIAARLAGTPGASTADIDAIGSVPDELRVVLSKHNGGFPFLDYTGLACAEICAAKSTLGTNPKFSAGLIPFARNVDDNYLVLSSGQVFEWDAEDGLGKAPTFKSLALLIEDICKKALTGKLEHCEGDGDAGTLIEVSA
mmetsp:Transcript_44887/g.105838  ORF Transcript_44887/g.105838 Transcript_44887/m.105838 type:complete len:181 (+) Transcript_44887:2-544(+)